LPLKEALDKINPDAVWLALVDKSHEITSPSNDFFDVKFDNQMIGEFVT